MITSDKEIYKQVAEENNKDLDFISSIGNSVFQETRAILGNPYALSYEVPELGSFILRFKKFEDYISHFEEMLAENKEDALLKLEKYPEIYKRNKFLLSKIKEYREDKKQVKQKRYEQNQTLKSGEDKLEKH